MLRYSFLDRQQQRGFTLLELLVTVSIVGILSAIAIPEYRDYQARAYDTRALGDLRTVALAEEAYFMNSEHYLSCSNEECASLPGVSALSRGVQLGVTGGESQFTAESSHAKGSGKLYRWESDRGGLQP
jgi:type IV pilus assembly protein PilA